MSDKITLRILTSICCGGITGAFITNLFFSSLVIGILGSLIGMAFYYYIDLKSEEKRSENFKKRLQKG